MPELPEVETVKRGLSMYLIGQQVQSVIIRDTRLRWPIPDNLPQLLVKKTILSIERRAKYLLIKFEHGYLILHLGMSGTLAVIPTHLAAKKHDHVDIMFHQHILRYNDPRRFGAILWTDQSLDNHPRLAKLGPEPLSRAFNKQYLYQICEKRQSAIKLLIMNNHAVVGVGNIYASESLFQAGIHPLTPACVLTLSQIDLLVNAIKSVLKQAIQVGGTTLKNFSNSDGKPGYFQQKLLVYGRANQACLKCASSIKSLMIGNRNSYYCTGCQKSQS